MARRVSWVNNSSGHTGTYVYRAPTLDPQNLPAPVATVGPVGQGLPQEWIDDFTGYECYAVQDFDGQGVGTLSTEVCAEEPAPDYANATVGDEIGGGIYVGVMTINATDFHIIAAKASGEIANVRWNSDVLTGADSVDDGLANQNIVLDGFDTGSAHAFYHCRDYESEGFNDWYLPALNELQLIRDSGLPSSHPEFSALYSSYDASMSSTETSSQKYVGKNLRTNYTEYNYDKSGGISQRARPVRRAPA